MGALLALLLPMVPGLVAGVEAIFTKPGAGQNKMDAVVQALRAVLAKMVAAPAALPTTVPPAQPTDEALQAMIETVLQSMKLSGQLGAVPVAVPPTAVVVSPALALDAGGFVGDVFASLGKRVVAK